MANDRIGIEIEVLGYDEAMRKMKEIERATSTFRGKNAVIEINGNWDTVRNHIRNLTKELKALQAEKKRLEALGAKGRGNLIGPLTADDQALENVIKRMKAVGTELNLLRTASQNTGRTLRQTFNSVSAQIAHFGGSLQSIGNALTRIAAPFQMLTGGALLGLGFTAMGKITSGLSAGFSRYDTMHKYPIMMQSLGYTAEDASRSVNKLDQAVRGLPTGLNEIIDVAQRYALSLGDIDKATDLAIATNNAFLASMATESQQYQGMLQLQDLLNGKELTSREWMSLGTSMGAAINAIGQELGYSSDQMGVFRQELYAGNIATEDFLNALIKVGTGEGSIAKMAELSKSTWEAVSRNIGNAFSRMGARILEAFDKISETVTGKTLVKYLADTLGPTIDSISASITKWIDKNQGKILSFFNDLKSLDIKGFAKGFVEGLGEILSMAQKFAKALNGRSLNWLGKFIGKAGFYGKWLTIFGGFVKGLRFPVAGLVTLIRAISEARGADLGGGLLGKLLGFGGKNPAAAAGEATVTVANFSGLLKALAGVATVAASVAMIGGAGFIAFRSVKTMLKDLGEIIDIVKEIDWDMGKTVLAHMGAFFATFAALGTVIGTSVASLSVLVSALAGTAFIGGITAIIAAFGALDTWLVKKAMQNIAETMQLLTDTLTMIDNMPKSATSSTGNVKKALNIINEVYMAFKPDGENKGLSGVNVDEAHGFRNRMKAFGEALQSLEDVVKHIVSLKDMPDMSGIEDNISSLIQTIRGIYAKITQDYTASDQANAERLSKTFESITGLFKSISDVYDILRVKAWNVNMKGTGKAQGREQGILGALDSIFAIYKEIRQKMFESGDALDPSVSSRISTVLGNLVGVFESIDSIYETIRSRAWSNDISGKLDLMAGFFVGEENSIRSFFKELSKFFASEHFVEQSGLIQNTLANLHGAFSSINDIYMLIREKEWTHDINGKVEKIGTVVDAIANLKFRFAIINGWKFDDVSGNIDNITKAVQSIISLSTAAGGLEGVDLGTLLTTLNELIPQVEEIGKAFTEGFIDELDFDKMSKYIKDGLDKVLRSANGYENKFRQKARSVASAFGSELQKELSHIDVNTTITVRISNAIVTGIGTVASAIQRGIDMFNAQNIYRGGTVYRAGGGSIFKPRGTDTVPAMLTVGEYVQNRHAVALFGKEFMDKVNALDIDGAMNALHSRFGDRISSSRVSTVNNIVNNNNNQQMTQNVYTNNPSFAKLRRNRYIGAL